VSSDDEQLWATIRADASPACVDWLRTRLAQPGLTDLTAAELAIAAGCTPAEAADVLERAAAAGLLTRRVAITCPCCNEELSREELADDTGVCPHCSRAFTDCGPGPDERVHYTLEAEAGRSVPWVLVLHGMNTRGGWQEELSWLIATTYGRSVPVFIYKYGRVLTGVLLGWRRRTLVRKLSRRIQHLAGERNEDRLGSRPDVIAHSFGTWMLGHMLASTDPELADLAVGRVVLLGSILRPSFSWSDVVARGRAEAVLNHYGTNDYWAGLGGYVIYDAGPSGRRGFDRTADSDDDQRVINREAPGFGHSTFFQIAHMRQVYLESWKPFLTQPLSHLAALEKGSRSAPWRQPPRVLRFAAAVLTLTLVAAATSLTIAAFVLGLIRLVSIAVG
jgi:hypothetical protein